MAYVIPTIFTGVDKYSGVLGLMGMANDRFSAKLGIIGARSERAFNRLPNLIGNATDLLIRYGTAAAEIGGTLFVGKQLLDFQTEVQDLSAVTGASGKQLDIFKGKIENVADATHKSMVDVAKAFTAVDNNMPELHTDAAGLADVTKQSIILAQASRQELAPAAEELTMTLNQFGLKADKARAVIDAMAGGAVAGSSRILETAEALQKFGAAAEGVVGITYNEGIALVELGSKFEKGSEAGTRMRNILLDLENIKFGAAKDLMGPLGVNMDIVSNKAIPLIDRLTEISKIKSNPEAMEKLFDKRNVVMASGLLSRIDDYNKILNATFKAGGAQDMASKNTDTFAVSLERLRDKFVNITIKSHETQGAMYGLNKTVIFLTDHLDGLTSIAGVILEVGAAWWIFNKGLKAVTAGMWLYNASIGVNTALQGESLVALGLNEGALAGYNLGARAAAVGTAALSKEMIVLGTQVGLITGGLATIIAYHKEIEQWANGSTAGLEYNYAIGDYQAVKDALINNYKDDPDGTKKFLQSHQKFNTPAIQSALAGVDKEQGMNAIDNRNKQESDNQSLVNEYENQHGGQEPAAAAGDVNIYLTVDKNGNVSSVTKNTPGAVQVKLKQTGSYSSK